LEPEAHHRFSPGPILYLNLSGCLHAFVPQP
jgi:hypothetical protein